MGVVLCDLINWKLQIGNPVRVAVAASLRSEDGTTTVCACSSGPGALLRREYDGSGLHTDCPEPGRFSAERFTNTIGLIFS